MGGAHINFSKMTDHYFFILFFFLGGGGGGHICANYWGGTAPRAPLFLRACLKAEPGKLDIKRREPGILFISLSIVELSLNLRL